MIYSIQALRALAALMVVFYHIDVNFEKFGTTFFFHTFSAGWFGVDIFFILSGFIITYTSYKLIGRPKTVTIFIFKRAIRIYPTYWMLIFLPFYLGYLYVPQIRVLLSPDVFSSENFIAVFFLFFHHKVITQVTWTLSYELYFYSLFALLIISRKFFWLIGLLIVAAFLNLIVSLGQHSIHEDLIRGKLINPLILEFGLGMLIYYLYEKNLFKKSRWAMLFIAISSLAILFFIESQGSTIKPYRVLLFSIPCFILTLSFVYFEKKKLFKNKIVLLIGDASYVLYLIHSPLISAFCNKVLKHQEISVLSQHLVILTFSLVIIALSILLHLLLEKPIIHSLRHFTKKAYSS